MEILSRPPSNGCLPMSSPATAYEGINDRVTQVSGPIFSRDCIKCAGGTAICAGSLLGAGLSWWLAPQSLGCTLATIWGGIGGCGVGARVCCGVECFS